MFFNALSLSLSLHTYTPNARRRGDDDERAIIRRETRGLKTNRKSLKNKSGRILRGREAETEAKRPKRRTRDTVSHGLEHEASSSFEAARDRARSKVKEIEAQMRKKEEALKQVVEELAKYEPTPLWKIVTDKQYKDIFETHILSKLDDLSFRVFREVNTESRDACRRVKDIELAETFITYTAQGNPPVEKVHEYEIKGRYGQPHFCHEAAETGNLELLRWFREEKKL